MKGLCLLWAMVSTVVLGLLMAGVGLFIFLGADSQVEIATPEISIAPETAMPCFFSWAHGDDPESQAAIEEALVKTTLPVTSVVIDAYGEDYVCPQPDGTTTSEFGAIDISPIITLSIPASDMKDNAVKGDMIGRVIEAVNSVQTRTVNQLTVVFQVRNEKSVTWSAPYAEILTAWTAGMSGADLYNQGNIGE